VSLIVIKISTILPKYGLFSQTAIISLTIEPREITMRTRAEMEKLKLLWETKYKDTGVSNRQAGRLLAVDHTVISRWINESEQLEYYSFQEIAVKLKLKPNQVKVVYLNATRKIKIILERKGIDIGDIPERLDDLKGQF